MPIVPNDHSASNSAVASRVAPPSRRVMAAVVDLIAMSGFALGASIAAFVVYVAITGNDFDGPTEYDTLGNWFALGLLSSFALLYSGLELLFLAGPGKLAFGLRITSESTASLSGRRRTYRWLIKYSALILLCASAWTAYQILRRNLPWNLPESDSLRFEKLGTVLSGAAIALIGMAISVNAIWFAARRGQMLHDRAAHTIVIDSAPPGMLERGPRGFEPIV